MSIREGETTSARVSEDPRTTSADSSGRVDRIISGIDLIDYGVGGLFPEKVYVVKGPGGTGKSILGLQFLGRGLEMHETGVLITDQKPEAVLAQARAIGFKLDEAVRRGQLQILNPSKRYFELVESPADVMAIIEELGDYVKSVGARRLVVDPVYAIINTSYSSHFAVSITQSLINVLEELPLTTILIIGDDENPDLNAVIRALEQNAYGVISLAPDKATGGRIMGLPKLRYASTDNLSAHYRILNGRGLINYRGEGEQVADVTKPWDETGSTRSVLILGSNPETIAKAREALGEGYRVSSESDLKRGIERVRAEKPGLVLVTPSRSREAISAIMELAKDSSSSIAFLSPSSNRAADRVIYLRAGADDFITEPFSAAEFKARVDALVRRSGRRLNVRDSGIPTISAEELSGLEDRDSASPKRKSREAITIDGSGIDLDPGLRDRLQRNIDTVSKFDMPFAVYWIKSVHPDPELNRSLAQLCRQEDVLCQNAHGEFIAILTGIDENGIRGFETRLDEKLGPSLRKGSVRRGYTILHPGQSFSGLTSTR
jgi:KaiC/GvpD/RAD55 family RecA-like ATPase/DNA-binding response OmpR family regulator